MEFVSILTVQILLVPKISYQKTSKFCLQPQGRSGFRLSQPKLVTSLRHDINTLVDGGNLKCFELQNFESPKFIYTGFVAVCRNARTWD